MSQVKFKLFSVCKVYTFTLFKYICVSSSNVKIILCQFGKLSVIQQSALAVKVWLLGEGQGHLFIYLLWVSWFIYKWNTVNSIYIGYTKIPL